MTSRRFVPSFPLPRPLAGALVLWLAAGLSPFSSSALAAAPVKYEKIAFEHAVRAGGPVALHFNAAWSPTSQLQGPILDQILREAALRPVICFVADYDRETLLKTMFAVKRESTLIVFKGSGEVARSIGETSRDGLRELLAKGLPRTEWFESSSKPASGAAAAKKNIFDEPVDRGPSADTPFSPFSAGSGSRP